LEDHHLADKKWQLGTPRPAISTEETPELRAPLDALFDGVREGDMTKTMRSMIEGGGLTTHLNGGIETLTWPQVADYTRGTIESLPEGELIDESLHVIECRASGDFGFVWVLSTVKTGGRLAMQGATLANLLRKDGDWRILSVPGCP
jgi:hypothetical protein